MTAALLVELVCEELPPKALARLGAAFAEGIRAGLAKRAMVEDPADVLVFATPRRLAVGLRAVRAASEPRTQETKLMPAAVGLDASGKATAALEKKLQGVGLAGIDPGKLKRRVDGKAEMLFADVVIAAVPLAEALQAALDEAIAGLPIPKVMTYQLADGETTVRFVRPAHALVALHGADVVPVAALGLRAGRETRGHRFQGAATISLARANDYERALAEEGGVIASFTLRRDEIVAQLEVRARELGASLGPEDDYRALLDEVTGLVEMPTVYAGTFDREFLSVPPECLTLTMRQNQKYFPLFDGNGKLTSRFLIVSNMRLADPANIVTGNERVVRPRLADARFFFETDRKTRLGDRVAQLGSIVYHNKLGTQLDRVERLRKLATRIQGMLPRGEKGRPYADRAACLAKADLVTLMVGEFPELQGIMGKYYAEADGEEPSVVRAIEQHYWPRFAGDRIPTGDVSVALALADKLETIAGMFGLGQQPTGDKDPFALRRHALGVVRILVEGGFDLSVHELVDDAFAVFEGKIGDARTDAQAFILERLRSYLRDQGYSANETEAVLGNNPSRFAPIPKQLDAIRVFMKLPEAASLAAANKRIQNILRKSDPGNTVDYALLFEPEEKALHQTLTATISQLAPLLERGEYEGFLKGISRLRDPVDAFFDKVLVNAEDEGLRSARLGLLKDLGKFMNSVADISKLAS
jgi:glycyl-tRNA synthetase beta chain